MKLTLCILFFLLSAGANSFSQKSWAIAIHGGAGTINPDLMTDSLLTHYENTLNKALQKGKTILAAGGEGLDAVEQVIHILENSPLFNAGKGAVFTHAGKNELDASVMSGKMMNAGAVAGVTNIKNPISAAIAVMKESEHVMLSGNGANAFAEKKGLEMADSSYFFTEKRWQSLQRAISEDKHGTVGCVVLDTHGNLYAGTSTGGRTNKKFGRIGDSPIIGAGTYAKNTTCAVSCTGHGEYFIRYTIASDISARMEYLGESLEQSVNHVIHTTLENAGGTGGVIAVDKKGNFALVFNTTGMYRAWADSENEEGIAIWKEKH